MTLKNEIEVDLSNLKALTNDVYYPHYNNKIRTLVLYGGAGSGKSRFAAQKVLKRIISEDKHRILVVRKVANTLRQSVFQELRELIVEWKLTRLFKINKSDMVITCKNGNEILFAGLDDVEKLKSIVRVTSIWIEEATAITESDYNQLNLRMRGQSQNYKQIILTFNPVSALSWLKKRFFDIARDNTEILKTTYKDNRFLTEEDRQQIKDLEGIDYIYFQIYALGEWGVLGNLVYTNYVIEPIETNLKLYNAIYHGLDFGFNNPSAYIELAIKDNEIYILKEFYQNKLTNTELIKELSIHNKQYAIIADSAEPDRIKEFKNAGFKMTGAKKEKGSVQSGIDNIKRRRVHIHPDCINTINEFQSYKYKEDKDGNVFDEPVDLNNHSLDAIRYALDELRKARIYSPSGIGINEDLSRISPNII